jgi:hypothetical protein
VAAWSQSAGWLTFVAGSQAMSPAATMVTVVGLGAGVGGPGASGSGTGAIPGPGMNPGLGVVTVVFAVALGSGVAVASGIVGSFEAAADERDGMAAGVGGGCD